MTNPYNTQIISPNDYQKAVRLALGMVQKLEGFREDAYQDESGNWTIGFGSCYYADGSHVKEGDTITMTQALALITGKVTQCMSIALRPITKPITFYQAAALSDLVYNIGVGGYSVCSSPALFNEGKADLVPANLMQWNKERINGVLTVVKGLTNRREAECQVWEGKGLDEYPMVASA